MKKILLIASLFISSIAFSQTQGYLLEQEVTEFKKDEPLSYTTTWKTAGEASVMEIDYTGTNDSKLVFLPKNSELYVYSTKQSQNGKNHYYKAKNDVKNAIHVVATKNKTTFGTYSATEYIARVGAKEISFWFTQDVNIPFSSFAKILEAADLKNVSTYLPSNGAILEYTIKNNGNLVSKVSFKSLTMANFNSAIFDFPEGYTLYTK